MSLPDCGILYRCLKSNVGVIVLILTPRAEARRKTMEEKVREDLRKSLFSKLTLSFLPVPRTGPGLLSQHGNYAQRCEAP